MFNHLLLLILLMSWNNIWEIGLRAESLLGNTVTVIRTLFLSWDPRGASWQV